MSVSLNAIATADGYTEANTALQAGTKRVRLQVNNAAIAWQALLGEYGAASWAPEEYLQPGLYSFNQACYGARVRSWVAGFPAQVTLTLLP